MSGKQLLSRRKRRTQATRDCKAKDLSKMGSGLSRINPNPPPLHLSPWNSATIIHKATGNSEVFVRDIATTFAAQLDPTGHGLLKPDKGNSGLRFQMKLHRIKLYAPDAKMIGLSIEDFLDAFQANKEGRDQLAGVVDVGTSSMPPALQYEYPTSHKNAVIRSDDIWWDVPLFNVQATASTAWLAFITIKWMFDGPIKFSMTLPTSIDFMNQLMHISHGIQKSQPSTFDKVVDGVVKTASYVSVLAGEESVDSRLIRIERQLEALKVESVTHCGSDFSDVMSDVLRDT